MVFAGGFAGLGGIINIMGLSFFVTKEFSNDFGFSGVAVALLGNSHPVGMIIAALLFGALNAGGNKMQLLASVPAAMIYIIQGAIILFAIGREWLPWTKQRFAALGKLITRKQKNVEG